MTLVKTLLAGLVGTSFMSVVMTVIHRREWANADMIRALGSCVTKSYEKALGWGLGIHFTSGALFAIPYAAILSAFPDGGFVVRIGLGTLLGLVHGLVMSLVLLAVVSEKHPLPQFQKAGFEVGVAHIFGHIAYGVGVAFMVELLRIDWGLRVLQTGSGAV